MLGTKESGFAKLPQLSLKKEVKEKIHKLLKHDSKRMASLGGFYKI
jgi:hypothetical protein